MKKRKKVWCHYDTAMAFYKFGIALILNKTFTFPPKIVYQRKWNKAWQTILDLPQAVPEVNTVAHIHRPEYIRQ